MSQETTVTNSAIPTKRARRSTSNIFARFERVKIQEFKVAFDLIDRNRDGFIDKKDLYDMWISLGEEATDGYLERMLNDAPSPIDFPVFLALFAERLHGTDPEDVIKNAFSCFDEDKQGVIDERQLREFLVTMGDKFTNEDVDEIYKEAPISNGMFNYIEFAHNLKHGTIQ